MIKTIANAAIATGSRVRRRPTLDQYPGLLTAGAPIDPASMTAIASAPLDAGIDRRLQHVDDQVEGHEEQGEHQDRPLQQRQVALKDRGVEQETGAGPGKHG